MNTEPIASKESSQNGEVPAPQARTNQPEISTTPEAPPDSSQGPSSPKSKSDLVQQLLKENEYMNVEFDDDTKRVVFQSVDRTSGKIVSQFPSEEILSLVAHFRQTVGVFTDQEV